MSEFEQWPDAEWPDDQRIDLIGQNRPTAEHYDYLETTGTAGHRMNGGDTSQGHERPNTGSDNMTGGEQ